MEKDTTTDVEEEEPLPSPVPGVEMLPPDIADKRFALTLETMKNDENYLWMELSKCRITDSRIRKLFAALKDNTSMTSIDLSNNVITDEGMSFLTGALAVGMVPNLLRINLQGNPISSKGRELLAGLYHLRKQLLVEYDMVEEPSEGESDLSVADDLQENFPRSKWIGNCTEANGPEDPEAQDLFSSAQRQRACDPHLLEEQAELLMQVLQQSATKSMSPAELASNLKQLGGVLTHLLEIHREKLPEWASADQLPKGLKEVVENIKTLTLMLDLPAAPHQSQRRTEEASAGLHRIAVVNVLGQLLGAGCPAIDGLLLIQAVPSRLIALFFQYPWNSMLQAALCKCFLAVLDRPGTLVCSAILAGGTGLPTLCAKVGSECATLVMSNRPGYAGYIVKLSKTLQVLGEKDASVNELLQQSDQWVIFAGVDGLLSKLVTEQTGHLGGPKPVLARSMAPFFQNNPGSCRTDDPFLFKSNDAFNS
ncbi:uncharacterized protein [Physcomitrium patens]|uniref:Uncharacterized protein n=1 Tax=Physcomitrium patens TaxID=3218 RepID=A0A7I4BPE1_PHYPA|nr:uncharacterized protein LOC112287881 isoform X1 [Physcomitrium patens]|eukprot:XP_024387248.1 uncharacterized protein LOC112287881 isoform X1 [Physcomitrella patens]